MIMWNFKLATYRLLMTYVQAPVRARILIAGRESYDKSINNIKGEPVKN